LGYIFRLTRLSQHAAEIQPGHGDAVQFGLQSYKPRGAEWATRLVLRLTYATTLAGMEHPWST